jgi:hypothetical protein
MFCPKCGKSQTSDEIRFCAKCGLLLTAARESLTGSTAMTSGFPKSGLSRRTKGILQGVAIIPAGIGTLAVLDIFYEALGAGMMGGLYATLTIIVLVAIARILYALILEKEPAAATAEGPATLPQKELASPIISEVTLSGVTAEILQPNTITDHTTRKLGSSH